MNIKDPLNNSQQTIIYYIANQPSKTLTRPKLVFTKNFIFWLSCEHVNHSYISSNFNHMFQCFYNMFLLFSTSRVIWSWDSSCSWPDLTCSVWLTWLNLLSLIGLIQLTQLDWLDSTYSPWLTLLIAVNVIDFTQCTQCDWLQSMHSVYLT